MRDKKQLCIWIGADLMDFFNKQADKYFEDTHTFQDRLKSNKHRSTFIVEQLERIKAEFEDKEDE